MTATVSSPASRAVVAVLVWCDLYTRNLDSAIAEQRRDEIASDLYEHSVWAREQGHPASTISLAIVSRAMRGAGADLSWRRAQQRREALAYPAYARQRRANGAVSAALAAFAFLLLAWGTYVTGRISATVAQGTIEPWSQTSAVLLASTALAACGLVLVLRNKTRALGALWLMAPTALLIQAGLYQLYSISVTVGWFTLAMRNWTFAVNLLTAGSLIVLLAAAIWAWPTRTPPRTVHSTTTEPERTY